MTLDNKGKTKIRSLLGGSEGTEAFIVEAEQAINTYFITREAKKRWLKDGPRVTEYKKVTNYSEKLSKVINGIPENQWGLICQHWLSRHGELPPIEQLKLIQLLQDLATATDDSIESLTPIKRGPKHKTENWVFINALMKSYQKYIYQDNFNRDFTNKVVTYSDGGTFLEIVTLTYNYSSDTLEILDPDQSIRDYLSNS